MDSNITNGSRGLPEKQTPRELAVLHAFTVSLFALLVISNSGSWYIINQSSWRKLFLDYAQMEWLHSGFWQLPRKKFKDIKACDNSGKRLKSLSWNIILNLNCQKKCHAHATQHNLHQWTHHMIHPWKNKNPPHVQTNFVAVTKPKSHVGFKKIPKVNKPDPPLMLTGSQWGKLRQVIPAANLVQWLLIKSALPRRL